MAREGEQRFDSHVDKLTNYIRFWQAAGESEKTSQRIKTRLSQMTADGLYTGGPVPFGYRLVKTGQINKKGREVKTLEIDLAEAEIVRMIFYKTRCEGYGSHRLAETINEMGIKTHKGSKFQCNTILRILRNRMYCGYFTSGEVISPFLPQLKIIEEEEFNNVQYIINQRGLLDTEKREIALSTKGKALLSGNVFCSHCGGRITTIHYKHRRIRKDGSAYVDEKIKYSCYHKSRKLCECEGQTSYDAERIDQTVIDLIKQLFSKMKSAPDEIYLQQIFKQHIAGNKTNQKKMEIDIQKSTKELENLQREIGKAIIGESVFTAEDLSLAIQSMKEHIIESQSKLSALLEEETNGAQALEKIKPAYMQFKSWAEEFDAATLEQKKMIVSNLFRRIEIGKDYQIRIVLNITYQQFCEEWQIFSEKIAV